MFVICLLAAVPEVIAVVRAIHSDWTPSSDDGVIVLRAFDVFSAHSPLLGQGTQSSSLIGTPVYNLGPLLYWVLAVPAHIGPAAVVSTMGIISASAVVIAVATGFRRGGQGLMFLTAGAMILVSRSLPAEVPYEPWNCWAGLYPFVAVMFLSWSVGCGELRLLPLLVIAASYTVQCHLTYLVPTLAVCSVAVGGLSLHRRRLSDTEPGTASRTRVEDPRLRPWLLASGAAFVLCWSATLIEQLRDRPGNLVLTFRLAESDHAVLGLRSGFWTLQGAIGLIPNWLRAPRFSDLFRAPPVASEITAAIIVAGLIAVGVTASRRRLHDVAVAAVLALVLCLAVVVVAGSIPSGNLSFAGAIYPLTWTSPAGMFVYLVLGWSTWRLLAPGERWQSLAADRWRSLAAGRGARVIACTSVAILAVLMAGRGASTFLQLPPRLGSYSRIRTITATVVHDLGHGNRVLLDVPVGDESSLTFQSSIALGMRQHDIVFAVPPRLAKQIGDQYCPRSVTYPDVVVITAGDERAEPDTRLLVHSRFATIELAGPHSGAHALDEASARREENPGAPSHCPSPRAGLSSSATRRAAT